MPASARIVDWRQLRWAIDRQDGVVTRPQCLAAGMSAPTIDWRLASGRWIRLRRGVYLTVPGRAGWHTQAMADLLSVSAPGLAASAAFAGPSAAYLWGLQSRPPAERHLVVPESRRLIVPPGVSVRRARHWERDVHETEFPWRTTLSVTIIDVAAMGTADHAVATVARAVQQRRVTADELALELTRRRAVRHGRLLREVLAPVEEGAHSTAEIRFRRDVVDKHGLPAGQAQVGTVLGGGTTHDVGYRQWGLIVEVDGRLGHASWSDRIKDGRRDVATLALSGDVPVRLFWPDVAITPCATAARLAQILTRRGWRGALRTCRRRGCVVRGAR